MTLRVAPDGLHVVGSAVADWDPPQCLLKLPHKDGQRWESAVTMTEKKGGFKSTTRYKMAAFGPEEVKVPAGTFACIRVEEENDRTCTTWYAPGVGVVKSVRVGMLTVADPPRRMETVPASFTPAKN
jgi:hypothetical protein